MIAPAGNSALYEEAKARVRMSLIGFLHLESENPSLGSGTLVSVGGSRGVVTAAHVWAALSQHKRVGIVSFEERRQGRVVDIDQVRAFVIGTGPWTKDGPDICFLQLPPDICSSLEARGRVFLNLDRRAEEIAEIRSGGSNDIPAFYCLAGVVGERTQAVVSKDEPYTINADIEGVVEIVDVDNERKSGLYDLVDCTVTPNSGYAMPGSHAGCSGGGNFLVKVVEGCGAKRIGGIIFSGVNFWEENDASGSRVITCHFVESVYEVLLAKIRSEDDR